MPFCLAREQIERLRQSHHMPEFIGAEMLVAVFETRAEVVREVLPRPLAPVRDSTAVAFVARYPETSFGARYNEGALFLACQYKGERGLHCLSMPVDDDMAMAGGREQYGYPKKIAEKITLDRDERSVVGSVTRKGAEILRIAGELGGEAPDDVMGNIVTRTEDWDGVPCDKAVVFLFKHFPSPNGTSFDFLPRLVREVVLFRPGALRQVDAARLELRSTPFDPLGEIPVVAVKRVAYGTFNNTMLPGRVVGRAWNPLGFVRHAFVKSDFWHNVLQRFDPSQTARRRAIRRKALRY